MPRQTGDCTSDGAASSSTATARPGPSLPELFRDEWLVAVDKPCGMLVHKGEEDEPAEQIAMKVLRDRLGMFIHTIHRLDRPTSGVLLFALDAEAQKRMQETFRRHAVQKTYLALVSGPAPAEQEIDLPLPGKKESSPLRPSRTHIRRLSQQTLSLAEATRNEIAVSLVEATPHTGRIHQIRRHLAAIDCPIVGDYLYGDIALNERLAEVCSLRRMMLFSRSLSFVHPMTDEPLRIQAPLPPEFARFYTTSTGQGASRTS